jgi:hypothetical protein
MNVEGRRNGNGIGHIFSLLFTYQPKTKPILHHQHELPNIIQPKRLKYSNSEGGNALKAV